MNRAARLEALRRQAGERLREFVSALFARMFGDPVENPMRWPTERLEDGCVKVQYGTSTKANGAAKGYRSCEWATSPTMATSITLT